jgi:hypothetical protein
MASNTPSDQTNPKDLLGVLKVSLGLVPAAGKIYAAVAMADGAKKYGPYNWRDKKVKLSVYLDAIERHLLAYRDGEDCASDSKLPHLAHIIACGCILADAIEGGFLIDDRPLPGPGPKTLDKFKKENSQPPATPIVSQPQSDSDRVVPKGFRYLESSEIVQPEDFYWSVDQWQPTSEPGRMPGHFLTYIRKI